MDNQLQYEITISKQKTWHFTSRHKFLPILIILRKQPKISKKFTLILHTIHIVMKIQCIEYHCLLRGGLVCTVR